MAKNYKWIIIINLKAWPATLDLKQALCCAVPFKKRGNFQRQWRYFALTLKSVLQTLTNTALQERRVKAENRFSILQKKSQMRWGVGGGLVPHPEQEFLNNLWGLGTE